jgi:hypothetical protein
MDNGIYYINDRYHDLFLQLNVFSDTIHLVTLDKENNIRPDNAISTYCIGAVVTVIAW